MWNGIKLWDNRVVAQNVKNLIDQGSSLSGAVYGAVGTAIADSVGVSGIYNAYEGTGFYGNRLSAGERAFQGGVGSVQLVGTALGLKAPVAAGGRFAYNAGFKGVDALGSLSLDIGAGLNNTLELLSVPRSAPGYRLGGIRIAPQQAGPAGFSTTSFGIETHQKFTNALIDQTGTKLKDWQFNTAPSAIGVDATYFGPKSRSPGFKYAELKPYTQSGYNTFQDQLNAWNLPAGQTQLWWYNPGGIIGSSGLNY